MPQAVNGHSTKIRHLRPLIVRTPQEKEAYGRLRRKTERAAVDRLIALLDELADDPDLEDGADDEIEENDANFGARHDMDQKRAWGPQIAGWGAFTDEGEPTFGTTPSEDARGFYAASPDDDREPDHDREVEHEGGDDDYAI